MADKEQLQLKDHPIQIQFVGVKEVTFRCGKLPRLIRREELAEPSFSFGQSEYNEETKAIQIFSRFSCGEDGDVCQIAVELVTEFIVDEARFPRDRIDEWATKAAFYAVFPFLREHVFALTSRVGLESMIIPLVEVPTFRIEALQVADGGAAAGDVAPRED